MINYCVNKPEDEMKINEFIWELRDLMEKHGVFLKVEENLDNHQVVTFTAYENIKDPDFNECLWFCEMIDMWPHEYDLLDNGEIVQVRS
jgi:hypothetical protein